ncbi:MAG TPA: type II toxin-antitoxin system RelB/DinJ family antitoxin [Verrucomicrobiae bacterium]|nr:type II toxin-antitoxin system RelB/DinJ family antitoxin [Verrucomicrobiae bacterium]
MKTAILNVKVDEQVKKRAQAVAGSFGIPLSTLVNAYLMELAETGQIHFSAVEIMTPKMEKLIEQAQKEIEAGDTVGPFDTAEEAIDYLKRL